MDLKTKGASAELDTFKQLLVKMSWNYQADFDIGALYLTKSGQKGFIYFGELGNLNAMPFMKLDKDAGVGDKVDAGGNQETMKITKLDDMSKVYILAWDYGAVQKGAHARFVEAGVKLTLTDDRGGSHQVNLDIGHTANVAVIATIDNTSPIGAKLINDSKASTLKGFTSDAELWALAES